MVPDLRLVIQLQDLDSRIDELRREIASLPKHVAEIAKTLDAHSRKVQADRAALAANQRERKQLELEVQTQEQKVSKLRDQMLEARTNEQYAAFKREIEFCEAAIRKHEDRILDRMGESEALEQNLKAAEAALTAEKQQVEAETQRARERTAADQRSLEETPEATPAGDFGAGGGSLFGLRTDPQEEEGGGGGRSHRESLLSLPPGAAAPVLPGPQEGRSGDVLRELRPDPVLQPSGRSRGTRRGARTGDAFSGSRTLIPARHGHNQTAQRAAGAGTAAVPRELTI